MNSVSNSSSSVVQYGSAVVCVLHVCLPSSPHIPEAYYLLCPVPPIMRPYAYLFIFCFGPVFTCFLFPGKHNIP